LPALLLPAYTLLLLKYNAYAPLLLVYVLLQ
jgi:hypothetical protein